MVASKRTPLFVGLGALAFLGLGGLLIWQFSRRSNLSQSLPVGINVIPAEAVLTLSFSTDVSEWQRLRQYGVPETQAQFDQFLAQWRDRIFDQRGIDFQQDIQPWVGPKITVAFLPSEDASAGLEGPPPLPEDTAYAVALLPIDSIEKAQAVLGDQTDAENSQEYQGIDIYNLAADESNPVYGALLGTSLVVVGTQLSTVEDVIDVHRGAEALAERPGLRSAFDNLDAPDAFMWVYTDMAAAARSLAERSQPPLPINMASFSQARGLAGAVLLESQGIRLQSVSWLEPGSDMTFEDATDASLMPTQLPAETLLMVSTSNFQHFWQSFQAEGTLGALLPFSLDNLALSLEAATGLSLEEDLLPWMAGEFALSVLAPSALPDEDAPGNSDESEAPAEEQLSLPNPALLAMVQVSNLEQGERTFAELDQVMAERYSFSVDALNRNGQTLTQWTSPFEGLDFSHGWLGENIAFLAVGQGVGEVLLDSSPLNENRLFALTTSVAPNPNNGYFFVDLNAIRTSQDSLLLPPLPEDGWVGSQAIEAIGVTATVLGERQVRYDLFAALRRGERPGALPEPEEEAASEEQPDGADNP